MVWTLVRANASFTRPSRRLVFTAVRLRCPTATLRLGFGCAANYAGYIKATVRLLVSWFLQSLMVQKILWPEIWRLQGRVHATEKLQNDENDRKRRFLSTFGF